MNHTALILHRSNLIFDRIYCRKYPVVFKKALNAEMFSEDGERYVDFLAVAGSMNYGHNNPEIKKAVLDYLADDRRRNKKCLLRRI